MAGFVLALLVEALLVMLVLTLGSSINSHGDKAAGVTVVRFKSATSEEQKPADPEQTAPGKQRAAPTPARPADPEQAAAPRPQPRPDTPPPPLILISPAQMASADIAALPRKPAAPTRTNRPMIGPPDTGGPALRDSARVSGSGPNGEPLYAAAWYREPYEDELRGYLSTATGPGWGLIACRTAPDYRVEDCVKIDEYPTGSNIARSVLAAAWQFRVRPPRIGGESKIGEWVRIRIDYDYSVKSR